ncbi:hypothetical protein CANCADRAFT_30139 [Tortispora caseinolytica NRRL Y-17796]|uniref:coproporphyrinogen oxidase n=1 Tax=Tortispora caseinolytica NRRL Y-17796 TaxID=767744 RepID=A0A1E4TJ60_9ASCO|nr:hypothetical protein CANCADRAFT_30139 [Tortispora caseinolytica NRRL Y-17796]
MHPRNELLTGIALGAVGVAAILNWQCIYDKIENVVRRRKPSSGRVKRAALKNEYDRDPEMRKKMEAYVLDLQSRIVTALEEIEDEGDEASAAFDGVERRPGKKFRRDPWERPNGRGHGLTCVIQDGSVFEKGGVNVSVIYGDLPKAVLERMSAYQTNMELEKVKSMKFCAIGLSMVIHPRNPHAPTFHCNYRYFDTDNGGMWWFGGGSDLTPSYLYEEDAVHFHTVLKNACDKFGEDLYAEFKTTCDLYFRNTHRNNEMRGIGGVFFDDFDRFEASKSFEMAKSLGNSVIESYCPLVRRRKDTPFTENQKRWQQLRRGRYVEFNLLHDRGTKFGIAMPDARTESILMSLPLTARWEYKHSPEVGTEEAKLMDAVLTPKDWVSL